MKRQRIFLKPCSQQVVDLPDDCWERVFSFLINDGGDDNQNYLKSLSLASKQFLSITNRHKLSLKILYPTLPHLPRILQRFTNLFEIRHLDLTSCMRVKSLGIHFDVPKLEMLNLTSTIVDDEALCVISKRCRGLLQLVLIHCCHITKKGVMHVVKSCTLLKEINLILCPKVHANVVASMVSSRPSLRKIATPPGFPLSDRNKKLFLRHGCLLES